MNIYFELYSPPKKDAGISSLPCVFIALKKMPQKENNYRVLTPDLRTETEIDYYVDTMIKELENLRKAAKRKINHSLSHMIEDRSRIRK